MQGIPGNDFDGLKSSLDMGFTSVVSMLNIITQDNAKSRTLMGSILDRIEDIADKIGDSFNTSLGRIGFSSFNNYSKLQYKVQLDIFKTLKHLTQLQQKLFHKLSGSTIDLTRKNEENHQNDNKNQGAFIGGKVINTQNYFQFTLAKADNKTLDNFGKGLKELNILMKFKKESFTNVVDFFKDIVIQLTLLNKLLKPAAQGFALLAGSLILLQFVSFVNIFKLAMMLPIIGVALGLFMHAIIKSMSGIKGGVMGMWKVWALMKALPEILVNLGKGILLLSIGLVIFNLVGWEALGKFTVALIGLGLAFKFMTDDHSWGGTAKLIMVVAIIIAITTSLLKTKDIPWDSVFKLPVAVAAIGIALRVGGFDKLGRLRIMNMLALSLMLITISLITFKYISWENVIKYNVFIALMGLSLRTIKKEIPVMSLMALGFVAITAALLDFQELNWMTMIQIIGVIGLLGFVVNKFVLGNIQGVGSNMTAALSGGGFRGGGMIGFALGLFLLTYAIERFSHIRWQSVLKAIAIIAVLGLTFKLFFQEKQTGFMGMQRSRVQVPSMIGFALGIGLLVLALDAMSEIEWKSVFQLVTLMVAIGLIFKFLMPQRTKVSGMFGFALGMGILVLALDAMTEISWESVFKLVTFMVGVGGAMWLISKGPGIITMIVLAGSIYAMVYTLEYLNKINPKIENILNFGLFVGIAAAAMFFIGGSIVNILLGVTAVLGIGWAVGVLADALAKVSTLKFSLEGTLVWFGGVILMGLAMAGIGALMMTGVGAILVGAGALAVLAIAGSSLLMAYALSEISQLSYSNSAFDQFSYGIKSIINAYIDLDPITTVASGVTALATLIILIPALLAIGVLKLIDYTFSGNNTLQTSTLTFTKSLGLLITSFNDNIGAWVATKAALKSVAILPILMTMYLASLLLNKISKTEWDLNKLGSFNTMFSSFISQTVETINTHKDALVSAQPGIKSILKLVNVASGLASVVRNISNLRFVEMGVVNGKLVVTGVRQLGPTDFENVGKSISKLLLALINPIKALGMDSDTWRIGSDTIQNPFKNNTFLNGIDNIKKISDAFKPFIDSIVNFTKTGITKGPAETQNFTNGVQQTAKAYGYVFWKLAQIKRANLLKDAFKTIDAIQDYNDLWDDLDFDSFQDYSKLFNSFLDRLADQNKWKVVHKNIDILTKNLQKTVKAINSIDLEKAAALEVNVKQLSDSNNIQQIKEVIEQFVNLFGIIGENQYKQAMAFGGATSTFSGAVQTLQETSVASKIENERNKVGKEYVDKIKKGELSLDISNSNLSTEEKKAAKEYDTNGDGILSNTDTAITMGVEAKLDKLISILNNQNSPWKVR